MLLFSGTKFGITSVREKMTGVDCLWSAPDVPNHRSVRFSSVMMIEWE